MGQMVDGDLELSDVPTCEGLAIIGIDVERLISWWERDIPPCSRVWLSYSEVLKDFPERETWLGAPGPLFLLLWPHPQRWESSFQEGCCPDSVPLNLSPH